MNQIPNIEEKHNTREEWESVTWNVLSNVQTGRMSLADAQDKLDAVLHQQLQKARQAGYNAGLADGDDDIPPLPEGKTLDDLIKDVWVDHSELDHQPDRPLNQERE